MANLTLLLDVEPKVGLARHAMASNVSGSAPGLIALNDEN